MKKTTQLLLRFNEYFFYLIYSLTLAFALLEAISYRGFVQTHFKLPLNVFIIATLISGTFILFSRQKGLFFELAQKVYYKAHLIFTPLVFLFWLVTSLIGSLTYDNFIFTKLHVTPEYLLPVVFLTIFFTTAETVKQATTDKKFTNRQKLSFLIIYIFFLIFIYQNQQTVPYAIQELKSIFQHPGANYAEKMELKWGESFYPYMLFLRDEIPPDSKVLLPPRDDPWGIEGNDHVMRGFIYPRKVVRFQKTVNLKKEDFDFVLLTGGFYSGYKQFPQFNLKVKGVILFDPATKKKTILKTDTYNYKDKIYDKKYGLIVLK